MRLTGVSKLALAGAAVLALSGCLLIAAPRQLVIDSGADLSVSDVHNVFVVSSRKRDLNGNVLGELGAQRSPDLSYWRYDVSVPHSAPSGKIVWPERQSGGEPGKNYVTAGLQGYAGPGPFVAAVGENAREDTTSGGDTLVFVHGFNTGFAHALYRVAQIDADFTAPGTKVLYDWPSAGNGLLYLHDLDSKLFARGGLIETLEGLARADASGIVLVAYSSGALLAMEALLQIKQSGRAGILRKLKGVIMVAPDIDIDLFRSQADAMGGLPQPFFVFVSGTDAVFDLFGGFWNHKPRLGSQIEAGDALADYELTIIDAGAARDNGGLNHLAILGSPTYISMAGQVAGSDLLDFAKAIKAGAVAGSEVIPFGKAQIIRLPSN